MPVFRKYCSYHAKKRRAVKSNTLCDAQKRQAPLIMVKSLLFIAPRRVTRDFRVKCTRNTSRNPTV
ncbi:hypothetical protein CLOSYM_01423 [[Clostridium] symbiosum ATCC 14940]|uniref:Uncharacterized protein n=1 Tax=[Clostridium] symbiosum ATCC 14940 TaxID=411472 RepID=A0ABC9U0A7_CLOSY|nr:hypothetical protein CLOSYM_01423 [[Clostridium] symbiosum ATCC 14940]